MNNMKYTILNIFLFLAIGISMMACGNDDDNLSNGGEKTDQVTLEVTLPQTLDGSDLETSSNRLRCILEIWSKEEEPRLIYRAEEVKTGTQSEEFLLNFTLQPDEYGYLIWVDYIDGNAETEQKNIDGISYTHYIDKYYDTSNLQQITVKDANVFVNNEMCDAFFVRGEFRKENNACLLKTDLARPFTKVSVRENDVDALEKIKGISFTYEFPARFNVNSGMVLAEKSKVTYSRDNFHAGLAPEGTLFFMYIFSDPEIVKMGALNLKFITQAGEEKEVVIPEALVELERGKHIKVSGNFMEKLPNIDTDFEIIYNVDVEDWNSEDVSIEKVN